MEFEELPTFTRQMMALMDDDEFAQLQAALGSRPEAGKVIPHGAGLRKLRWAGRGRGKRGGLRVIYYWWVSESLISLPALYAKSRKDDLSAAELKQLRQVIESE
jgi:mRNA-degrading endonuclease RelE of RelBE toxin-antitoxin system